MRTYKNPSTVLNKAADLLQDEGWTRGAMECVNGKRCAVGAVAAITGDLVDDPYYDPEDNGIGFSDEPIQVKNTKRRPSALFNEALYYLGESLLPEDHWHRPGWNRRQSAYEREGVIVGLNDDDTATRAKIVKAMRSAAEIAKAQKR